jgi:hypothetical protein
VGQEAVPASSNRLLANEETTSPTRRSGTRQFGGLPEWGTSRAGKRDDRIFRSDKGPVLEKEPEPDFAAGDAPLNLDRIDLHLPDKPISSGGQGRVYRVTVRDPRNPDTDLTLAVKTFKRPKDLQTEWEANRQLPASAFTIPCHGPKTIDGQQALVFDFVEDSRDLMDAVRTLRGAVQQGEVTPDDYTDFVCSTAQQVLEATDFLHNNHVAHWDIKPGNFLLNPQGLRLCDLGLATIINPEVALTLRDLARAGGTPGFQAPETLKPSISVTDMGNATTELPKKVDLYAIGNIWHMLFSEWADLPEVLSSHGDVRPRTPDPIHGPTTATSYAWAAANAKRGYESGEDPLAIKEELRTQYEEKLAAGMKKIREQSPPLAELIEGMIHPHPNHRMTLKEVLMHPAYEMIVGRSMPPAVLDLLRQPPRANLAAT